MKCIICQTDNNLKDRTDNNGCCKNCGHRFAFEPTAMTVGVRFTDPFFAKVISDISVNYSLYFTPKQFLYFLDKRLKNQSINSNGFRIVGIGCIWLFLNVWATLFFGGFLSIFTQGTSFILVPVILNLGLLFRLFSQIRSEKLTYKSRQGAIKFFLFLSGLFLVAGIGFSLRINSFPLFVISTIVGMTLIYWGTRQLINKKPISQSFSISLEQVRDWLKIWQSVNPSIDNLLPPSSTPTQSIQINPEILNYSFDRVVVCQSAEIAQFLIANNFHFENNCAVLGVTRYPENIFDTVLQMLRQNPQLKVYALHNANPRGVSLINHLRTSDNWFANTTATIYDLGLLPRQVLNNPKLFVQQSDDLAREAKALPLEIKQTLLPEEINWLEAGYFVELESFSPQHLLRIVTGGIALSRQEDALTVLEDEEMTRTSIYAVQSFG